jgi:hypothetical protein
MKTEVKAQRCVSEVSSAIAVTSLFAALGSVPNALVAHLKQRVSLLSESLSQLSLGVESPVT